MPPLIVLKDLCIAGWGLTHGLTQILIVIDKAKNCFLELLADLRSKPTVYADETS